MTGRCNTLSLSLMVLQKAIGSECFLLAPFGDGDSSTRGEQSSLETLQRSSWSGMNSLLCWMQDVAKVDGNRTSRGWKMA